MDENALFQASTITDINEQVKKEEELLNTIKMEPILLKTEIEEEESIVKKKKRIRVTDYCLISMIVILSVVFLMVIFNVM